MAVSTLIVVIIFCLTYAIISVLNTWAINHVSDNAFEYGKNNQNATEYNITGTAKTARTINILLAIISILAIVASGYFMYKDVKK